MRFYIHIAGKFATVICLGWLALSNSRCSKEFSYEYQSPEVLVKDSTPLATPFIPSCIFCSTTSSLPDSAWSFQLEGSRLCGMAERAIITLERTSFTFFGPSFCSADSGFVASVYLNEPLNGNKTNITARLVAFYYYDRIKPSYVLISRTSNFFSLVIETYTHQTGIATGRFEGAAFTEDGFQKNVTAGRFRIKFS